MTVYNRTLDVQRDINPLHLYRPINNATWTTLETGAVSVLKDNGRGTTKNLTQGTAANRPDHGTDSRGNEFMEFTKSSPDEQFVQGAAAADWTFLNFPGDGGGATIGFVVAVDDLTADSIFYSTSIVDTETGVFGRINARNGNGCTVYKDGNQAVVQLAVGGPVQDGQIGPVGIYSYVGRYRKTDDISQSQDPENRIDAELSVSGTRLIVNQPLPFSGAYLNQTPNHALVLGNTLTATNLGLRGKIYEAFFDDRYLSDTLVAQYHARAVSQFGAFNMNRT